MWKVAFGGTAAAVLLGAAVVMVWRLNAAAEVSPPQPAAVTGVPVTAGTVVAADVPVILRGLGTVQAFNTVTVKSRVDGNIVRVAYAEGQYVKKGDLLVEIDPRPYQAQLEQAQANGGDLLQLTRLFGISDPIAIRYCEIGTPRQARQ